MLIETTKLTGIALNWAVAKCEGIINGGDLDIGFVSEGGYTPSTDWGQGGPIIEKEGICINSHLDGFEWFARDYWGMNEQAAKTPLEAAMRCFVASKLGDTVEVPVESF